MDYFEHGELPAFLDCPFARSKDGFPWFAYYWPRSVFLVSIFQSGRISEHSTLPSFPIIPKPALGRQGASGSRDVTGFRWHFLGIAHAVLISHPSGPCCANYLWLWRAAPGGLFATETPARRLEA